MPFDGSGIYSLPAAYLAVNGTTIQATTHNTPLEDIATALTACIKANGSKAFTAEQLLAGNPSNALGAAPKQYVDAQVAAAVANAGITIKQPVLLCTTGNITLSGEQTIDGTLTSANRVLAAFQTAPAENGIYVTGAGGWARASDADSWTELVDAIVPVQKGTQWDNTLWRCSVDSGGTLGTTAVTWRRTDGQFITNAQTGTSYTVTLGDHLRVTTLSNASPVAVTLPQATGAFGNGFIGIFGNIGAGAATITPTTSTINGGATLILRTGDFYIITVEAGNYRATPLGLAYQQVVNLTEDATPDGNADFVVTADASATLLKKVRPQNLMTAVGLAKTAGYTVTDADRGSVIRFTGLASDVTLALPAASGRNGFEVSLSIEDTNDFGVIADPNASELLDTFLTRKGYMGTRVTVFCDGTGWRTKNGTWRYFSGNQTITLSGSLTLAHGLGVRPRQVWAEIRCVTAEGNYSIGDIVPVPLFESNAAGSLGASIVLDATNLNVRFAGTSWQIANKSTGASFGTTAGNWNVRFYAQE